MKKVIVVLIALISLVGISVLAGPTLTLRSLEGQYIPSLGIQYDGRVNPWIELYKSDFYSWTWTGSYWIEGGFGVAFNCGGVDLKLPFGVAFPVTVTVSPMSFTVNHLYGVAGVWVYGGHGSAIRFENYFDGHDSWWSLGFQVDLHGLWLMLDSSPSSGGGQ